MAKEVCISCGKETSLDTNSDKLYRYGYIKDAGQLCFECAEDKTIQESFIVKGRVAGRKNAKLTTEINKLPTEMATPYY